MSTFSETTDRFGSVVIDLTANEENDICLKAFESFLTDRVEALTTDRRCPALWLRLPLRHGSVLPAAARQGLRFHHAEGDLAVLCRWLGEGASRIPQFGTHQLGIAAIVLNDKRELLMVKEKSKKFRGWKLPTGLADANEDVADAARREVSEETGVHTEFCSVLSFRHQPFHPGAFGRADILIACRLRPLTLTIDACTHEISACDWVGLDKLMATELPHYTTETLKLVRHGLANGWDSVDLSKKSFPSVYSGKLFHMYSRDVVSDQ